jgi:hypothetical protein
MGVNFEGNAQRAHCFFTRAFDIRERYIHVTKTSLRSSLEWETVSIQNLRFTLQDDYTKELYN